MRPRRVIERRARIFLGCEGESEQGYGAFLQRLTDAHELKVHIAVTNLQPAGDPLKLAKKAVLKSAQEASKGGFIAKAIMLDTDRLADLRDGGREARELLSREGFITIWQRPDHEGFLFRHFQGRERHDPHPGSSMAALQRVWPGYHKNMPAVDLRAKLDLDDVLRAAGVETELMKLLRVIGLSRPD